MLSRANHPGLLLAVLFLVVTSLASVPRAQAGESGMTGYEICASAAPGNAFYVAGDPVYISAIIKTNGEPFEYERAFRDFLKHKYGFTKYVSCSISYTSDGATKTFNGQVKQAGSELVRTGWKPALPSSPAASSPSDVYWICTATTSDATSYLSDTFTATNAGNGYMTLVTAFRQYLITKYGLKGPFHGAPDCFNYGTSRQRAQDALKALTSHGGKYVLTGWTYR